VGCGWGGNACVALYCWCMCVIISGVDHPVLVLILGLPPPPLPSRTNWPTLHATVSPLMTHLPRHGMFALLVVLNDPSCAPAKPLRGDRLTHPGRCVVATTRRCAVGNLFSLLDDHAKALTFFRKVLVPTALFFVFVYCDGATVTCLLCVLCLRVLFEFRPRNCAPRSRWHTLSLDMSLLQTATSTKLLRATVPHCPMTRDTTTHGWCCLCYCFSSCLLCKQLLSCPDLPCMAWLGMVWCGVVWWGGCWRFRYGLGDVHHRREQGQIAESHFRRALQINPFSPVLRCHLGMVLQMGGKLEEALDMLHVFPVGHRASAQVRFQRASVLLGLNRLEVRGGVSFSARHCMCMRAVSPRWLHDRTDLPLCFVLCALCFVLCALCFVLCALCFVLCALCFVLCALCFVVGGATLRQTCRRLRKSCSSAP